MPENLLYKLKNNCKFLKDFTDDELFQLIKLMTPHTFESGEYIFHKNDPADNFFIVISGEVKVFNEDDGKPLAILESGDIFGEMGILLKRNRISNARATQISILFDISEKVFKKATDHMILVKIYKNLARAVAERYLMLAKNQHESDEIEDAFWSGLPDPKNR